MKSQSSHCRVKGAWHDTQTGYSSPTCIKAVSFNCVLFFFFFNLMQMYHSSPFPFSSPCKIHWPAIFSQHSFSTYTRVRKTSDLSSHSHRIRALYLTRSICKYGRNLGLFFILAGKNTVARCNTECATHCNTLKNSDVVWKFRSLIKWFSWLFFFLISYHAQNLG